MPTILRFHGFNIMIFVNDHVPVHVHAIRGDDFIVIELHCTTGETSIRDSAGVKTAEARSISAFVSENRDILCAAWEKLHGQA